MIKHYLQGLWELSIWLMIFLFVKLRSYSWSDASKKNVIRNLHLRFLVFILFSGLFFEVFETKVFNFTDSLMIIITNQAENRCLPKVFRLQPPFCLLFGSFQQFWFFAQNYPVLWTLHWTAGACANLNQFCRSNTAVINDNYYHRLWILGKQIII